MRSLLAGVFIILSILISPLYGQKTLSKEDALAIALEKNFGIQISKNNVEIIKNNSSLLNSGYLPSISISGGSNFIDSDSEIAFQGQVLEDGSPRTNLNLNGSELITVLDIREGVRPSDHLQVEIKYVSGDIKKIKTLCRIDTKNELEYYKNGGILQYVLRNMI